VLIGKPGEGKSALCTADADRITIIRAATRPRPDGAADLHRVLLLFDDRPEATAQQRFFLDLLLVAIAEHGLTLTAIAARMTYDADPACPGSPRASSAAAPSSPAPRSSAATCSSRRPGGRGRRGCRRGDACDGRGMRVAGAGCPASAILHRPPDPRAERIPALADTEGVSGHHVDLPAASGAADAAWGKPLVMNASCRSLPSSLDLHFPATGDQVIPAARTGGLLAHLPRNRSPALMHRMPRKPSPMTAGRRLMFEPAIEALPGGPGRHRRRPLSPAGAYLFANSRFYRRKLGDAGFDTPEAVGGSTARHPAETEKDEIRETRHDDEPVGTHLCVPLDRTTRIFSTSGTTGTPSYIPLTATDVANWTRISARTYSTGGTRRGDGLVSTYGAGPFVAGITFDAFNLMGVTHIPIGGGNTERLMTSVRLLKPDALALTPSYALHLAEWAQVRGIDTRGSSGFTRCVQFVDVFARVEGLLPKGLFQAHFDRQLLDELAA
jgi:hypothetical protein